MFESLRNKFPLTDDKWNEYISYFMQIKIAAKTILLHEGEIPNKFFIIEKGAVRVWFNNDGKDVTTQFFFENNSVASIESFKKETPSPVTIESIEPSVVCYIHKKDAEKILAEVIEIPVIRNQFIDTIFERTFDYMKHFVSFIKDSPLQRYVKLIEERPQLIQRVPQHYIASYLGVTTVHLSRIKNKLAKPTKHII